MSLPLYLQNRARNPRRRCADGEASAREIVEATLARIAALNPKLGAFTDVTAERALAKADAIDAARARAAKRSARSPARRSRSRTCSTSRACRRAPDRRSTASARRRRPMQRWSARLEAAGAILVGALNMGEYAYDFTGENAHDGPSRNPHDLDHMTGGSSGGSGSAVAGGLVPLALGSDTNGSIRVPASLCGIFGLKPTYGRLSRAGTFPFVASLDHLGPFARSVADLAASYDAMQGPDAARSRAGRASGRAALAGSRRSGSPGLRIAQARRLFRARRRARGVRGGRARRQGARRRAQWSNCRRAERARAAAYLITMVEGAALHVDRLRERAADFDPDVRDRLIAGAMLPGAWVVKAQKLRRWFRAQALELFRDVDVLLAPATPCRAPQIGQKTFVLDGREMLVRPNLGLFTQPISFIGLPVVAVPVWTEGEQLPIGVQVIAPPWREDLALRVARALERDGVVSAPIGEAARA